MRTTRIAIVSLLVLTWVLLTFHCPIASIPGFEFLRCATESHEHETGGKGDPCKHEGCCSVEFAQYQAPRQHEIAPVIVFDNIPVDNFGVVEQSLPKQVTLGILTAAPPELPTSWQFISRTALPVRAPSLAS